MKLIAAAAALTLVAGGVDVEAQTWQPKRGKQNSPGGDKTPGARAKAPEGAEEASQPMHLARFAVAHFDGLTGEDRGQLIEAAQSGDETAQEILEAAVTAGLERVSELLADENTRGALELGITLGFAQASGEFATHITGGTSLTAMDILDRGLSAQGQIDALEEQVNEWTGMVEYSAFSKMRTSDSE